MRIKITRPGIYGSTGPVEVGTELTVKEEPKGWAGRYQVISGDGKGKTAVTNPEKTGYAVKEKSAGWFVITKDGADVTKSLRKDDVSGFDEFSEDDKAAFVAANEAD